MRVISGKYKGKIIKGFNIEGTRPTMDRVKESMFAVIQNNIKGTILDLFAGSGNLGFEALSNGGDECYFVDSNTIATNVIKDNIKSLNIKECTNVLNMDYKEALIRFQKNNIKFDLILLDPPYKDKILNNILKTVYNLVNSNGIVVLEYENEIIAESQFQIIKTKKYGQKYVTFLKKK